MIRKLISTFVAASFLSTFFTPIPQAEAQNLLGLPEPGTMVSISPAYNPAMIKGVMVHKDNPFVFDFIMDVGQDHLSGERLKTEGEKLIKYFLAGLTIPEKSLWVNLSPYEKDRIIPEVLSQTAMGRDLLAQDYLLKQISASLIYPDKELGRAFWGKVYAQAQKLYGTTEAPVNTFNKVWITADRAEVYEHNNTAFVVDCHLKVMMDQDYLAMRKNSQKGDNLRGMFDGRAQGPAPIEINQLSSQMVRTIILPELEKEVNTGKNFAQVRQVFNAIILASWYKNNLKQALLNQVYANKGKVKGIDLKDKTIKDKIYRRYLQAYKKGVFNYIKEDVDPTQGIIPRKYFSGGMDPGIASHPDVTEQRSATVDAAMGNRGETVDLQVYMNGTPLSEVLAPQHLGTVVEGISEYSFPDGRKMPLVRISEIYNSGFSPEMIANIRAQIQNDPHKHALLLRKSIIEMALNGDQEIALTRDMGDIPESFLFDNLRKKVKLSKKATEILPNVVSHVPSEIRNAPQFVPRVGGYFRTEVIDPKYDEPLYLVCFNYERLHQRNELVITPVGGGADFNGQAGKDLYINSGLHLEPIQVSPLDRKDELMAMRQVVSLNPQYQGHESPWTIFWRVYSGGRASSLREGIQEYGKKELALLTTAELKEWVHRLRGNGNGTVAKNTPPATPAQTSIKPKPVENRHPDLLNGGIDLDTQKMHWYIRKEGRGVEMNIDPAMIERVKREGLESLTPFISSITTVVSIWPLIGLQSPPQRNNISV